jgi:hypothetical protein
VSGPCIPIEELARVAERPADDPARRHLERCPHCQSLLVMLRDFETSGERPAAAGFEAADPRLLATIAELTGVNDDDEAPAPARRVVGARPAVPWWRLPMPRLAAAFAALALVSVASVSVWRAQHAAPIMRAAPGRAVSVFVAREPRAVAGGLVLEWSALPAAEAYQVVFLDDSLREIAHLGPLTASALTLDAAALPAGLVHGTTVGWQVEALAGGDLVDVTPTRALRVP